MSYMTMGDEIHALRCDRDSLMRERDALVEQVAYWREGALGAEGERDALSEKLAESDHALMQLGRLKAQWQAEALDRLAIRCAGNRHVYEYCTAEANELRRQAKDPTNGHN